jgi:hypothetical protein
MPALSPTMEEGKLAKWHVNIGDKVTSGDVIAEIEPTKRRWRLRPLTKASLRICLWPRVPSAVNTVIAQLRDGTEVCRAEAGAAPGPPAPKKRSLWRQPLRHRRRSLGNSFGRGAGGSSGVACLRRRWRAVWQPRVALS